MVGGSNPSRRANPFCDKSVPWLGQVLLGCPGRIEQGLAIPRSILQIRGELLEIEPRIWRRLQVPGDYSFRDLHVAIQSAFAWTHTHPHEFLARGQGDGIFRFGMPMDAVDDNPPLPGGRHRVADVLTHANPRLQYAYDFGHGWDHSVVLKEILEAALGKKYPRCTAGERSALPDDCGTLPRGAAPPATAGLAGTW